MPRNKGRHVRGRATTPAPAETTADGGRRWMSKSTLAAGGAASLAVGAVLGGAFVGAPGLVGPPAADGTVVANTPGAAPSRGSPRGPLQLAATHAAAGARRVATPAAGQAAPSPHPGPGSTGTTIAGTGWRAPSDAPLSSGPGTPGGSGSATVGVGDGAQVPTSASTCAGALCSTVQSVGQAASQVPGAGGALSSAVSTVGSVVGATGGTAPALPGGVAGVTSTVSGLLSSSAG